MKKHILIWLLISITVRIAAQDSIYDKLWNDPVVVERIKTNIEKYRKGDAVIQVLDQYGQPVKNALIEVHQKTHEFLFGCNLFVLGQLKTPELNAKYETGFTNLFNFATLPFYWGGLEPQEGKPRFKEGSEFIWRRPPPDQLLKWCKTHNITPKGHCLMYVKNVLMPDWTERNNPKIFLKQAHKHIKGIAKRYGNDIAVWDVANEEWSRRRSLQGWHKVPEDYLVWCFREANSLFPKNVKLLYNDDTQTVHDHADEYISFINELTKKKARVDGMGVQFHLFNLDSRNKFLDGSIYPPNQLINTYDQLKKTGLPVYITEITVPGNGDNGSMFQAKIVENLYRLWFSTPNIKGISWWNLGDGTAYKEENNAMAGLLDKEMNPKPAYQVLDRLINHEWKTNESLNTGSDGKINFRGFYGKYKISVKYQGKELIREIDISSLGKNSYTIEMNAN